MSGKKVRRIIGVEHRDDAISYPFSWDPVVMKEWSRVLDTYLLLCGVESGECAIREIDEQEYVSLLNAFKKEHGK